MKCKFLIFLSIICLIKIEYVGATDMNYGCTYNSFETTCTMKVETSYYDYTENKRFTPTKEIIRDSDKLYKYILKRVQKNDKYIKIKRGKYKNLSKVIATMEKRYFRYSSITGVGETDCKGITYVIYNSKTIRRCIKENKYNRKLVLDIINKLGINKTTTEHDACVLFNNYLVLTSTYDYSLRNVSDSLELLRKHKGVCEDYATVFMYLCNEVGIKCGVVHDFKLNHAYNIVKIAGKSWYFDITWNSPSDTDKYIFMREDELSSCKHKVDAIFW